MMVVWSLKWVGSYHEWAVHKRRSKTASEIMCFQIIRVLHKRHRIREPKVDNFLCWGVSWISKQHSSRVFFFSMSSETRLVSSIRCTLFLFPLWIFIKALIMSPLLLVSFCSGMSATHLRSFLQLNGFQICFASFSCYSRVCAKSFWCGHTVHLRVWQMSFQFCEVGGVASIHKRT